jgi:Putative prokaryotic signal transducing protein
MAMMDPQQEKLRLEELYASDTDEQLENVAAQAHELTEVARETLRAELSKRGLYVGQLEGTAPDQDNAEFRDLVTIRAFWNLLEAELAKGLLDSAGIESFLFDDNMVRLDWFNANALGGVKLRVDAGNVDAANQVLEEAAADATATPEESDSAE